MKSGYYIKLTDPLGLAVLDLTDYYGEGKIITRINVPEPHQGKHYGSQLLKEVCDDADKERVSLFLEISPSGPLDYQQLYDWYVRYGFRYYLGIMRRRPK
jgi:GNAT superfamily N-acetyltransferase